MNAGIIGVMATVLMGSMNVLAGSTTDSSLNESHPGRASYVQYCSACHGIEADGDGPVANVLRPPPPALKLLHAKYEKPLGEKLRDYVLGTSMPRAHGESDMPVWGRNLLEGVDSKTASAKRQIIWRIINYLDSIQVEESN